MLIPRFCFLKEDEQAILEKFTKKWVINGPKVVFVGVFTKIQKRKGISLLPTEYTKIVNNLSGEIRIETGPKFIFLDVNEEIQFESEIISLRHNEYIKILDKKTGKIRIIKGESTLVLGENEEIYQDIQRGINIDEQTAVLVRNMKNGDLKLIKEKQVFIPKEDEEIIEVRRKILLENHETVIIKDKNGTYIFKTGIEKESSFFLEPFQELVNHYWSSGIKKDKRNLKITHLDSRPKFMWYEFDIRTKDNVELLLGITFFWQLNDVKKMINTTDDAPGDVCSHARSIIIQSVSKVPLEKFLDNFNNIVKEAIFDEEDDFYEKRGVKIHSIEVRSISCKDNSTQLILQEIIQETTNRLNKIQKQDGENEVKKNEMKGQIEREEMRAKLIEIQSSHKIKESEVLGESEAVKIKKFFNELGNDISFEEKMKIFTLLKKEEYIKNLGNSKANLYFTPSDIDLSIETREK